MCQLTLKETTSTEFSCLSEVKASLDRSIGFQEVEALRFQDIRHMKVVRLSALRPGRIYPPGIIPGSHFC
jgi:hypothetical protein